VTVSNSVPTTTNLPHGLADCVNATQHHKSIPFVISTRTTLPAVPPNVIDRIRRSEFHLNLNLLLPSSNLHRPAYQFSIDKSDPSKVVMSLQSSSSTTRVTDLSTWFLAWSAFLQIMLIYRGQLSDQLIRYQLLIAQFAHQLDFAACYAYDQGFRAFMSNNPGSRWDIVNDTLYNCHLKGSSGASKVFFMWGG